MTRVERRVPSLFSLRFPRCDAIIIGRIRMKTGERMTHYALVIASYDIVICG